MSDPASALALAGMGLSIFGRIKANKDQAEEELK